MKKTLKLSVRIISMLLAAIICVSGAFIASAAETQADEVAGITDNEALKAYVHEELLKLMKEWDGVTVPRINIKDFAILQSSNNQEALVDVLTDDSPETYMNLGYEADPKNSRSYGCSFSAF